MVFQRLKANVAGQQQRGFLKLIQTGWNTANGILNSLAKMFFIVRYVHLAAKAAISIEGNASDSAYAISGALYEWTISCLWVLLRLAEDNSDVSLHDVN